MNELAAVGLHLRHPGAEHDAVRDVFLELRRGETLALVGPNGSGKSTLLAALAGLLRPRHGGALARDLPIARLRRRGLARTVAHLPQDPACPSGLTVEQLVLGGRNPHLGLFARPTRTDLEAVDAALAAVDLADLRRRAVETLSGGERRRAWIAVTLAQGSDVLLLDEPMSGLDLGHRLEIEELLACLKRDRGATLALVLHDLAAAVRVADRVVALHRGRVYAAGRPEEVLTPEALADVFGVDGEVLETGRGPALIVRGAAARRRAF